MRLIPNRNDTEKAVAIPAIGTALSTLCTVLPIGGLNWAVTGSAALPIRGFSAPANDIDIIATKDIVYLIEARLGHKLVKPFSYSTCENIRSLFGVLRLANFNIEIMADVFNRKANEGWRFHSEWQFHIEIVRRFGLSIPLLTLDYERWIALMLGNAERAKAVHDLMETSQQA